MIAAHTVWLGMSKVDLMPDFRKLRVTTEKRSQLMWGVHGMTLEQLAKELDIRVKSLIREHGPDAKIELLYRNNWYDLYITRPEHIESDQEYNERIVKEIKGK